MEEKKTRNRIIEKPPFNSLEWKSKEAVRNRRKVGRSEEH